MAERTTANDLGRWSDPPLLVLASLAGGPRHGYAIIQDVADQTGVRLGPGTLYGAIGRLEERGLIEALPPVQRRRPYQLTAAGRQALADTARQLRQVADLGLSRLAVTATPS
jgi:DNA-binding PadR family transcriptional regulator